MKKVALREEKVLELLAEKGKLTIKEISDNFNISQPTARRLSESLFRQGKILRSHGSIQRLPGIKQDYSYQVMQTENADQKIRIARYAVNLIKNNNIIFLEAGTTVEQCAVALAERIKSEKLTDITIFTNSLPNLTILSPVCNVYLIGGLYRPDRKDFSGYLSERTIRNLRFDYCFVGADALNITDGIMASDVETVRFDELLISRSERSIILVHSDKFRKHSLISYAQISDVTTIITDQDLSPEIINEFTSAGVDLICV